MRFNDECNDFKEEEKKKSLALLPTWWIISYTHNNGHVSDVGKGLHQISFFTTELMSLKLFYFITYY